MTQPLDLAALRERCEDKRRRTPPFSGPITAAEGLALIKEIERLRDDGKHGRFPATPEHTWSQWCDDRQAEVERLREALKVAREALEPFDRHRRAIGEDAFPVRYYTDTGYREAPESDFVNVSAALATIDAAMGDET